MASKANLPKSGAISKGYNFASNWEQVFASSSFNLAQPHCPRFKFTISVHMHLIFLQILFTIITLSKLQIRSDRIGSDPFDMDFDIVLSFFARSAEHAINGAAASGHCNPIAFRRRATLPSQFGQIIYKCKFIYLFLFHCPHEFISIIT